MESNTKPTGDLAVASSDLLGCWLYAEYGWSIVVGQVVGVSDKGYLMRFRWGNPYRTVQLVPKDRIVSKAEDPRWLWRLARIFQNGKHPNVPDERRPE
jgi:hypothetical protein